MAEIKIGEGRATIELRDDTGARSAGTGFSSRQGTG